MGLANTSDLSEHIAIVHRNCQAEFPYQPILAGTWG